MDKNGPIGPFFEFSFDGREAVLEEGGKFKPGKKLLTPGGGMFKSSPANRKRPFSADDEDEETVQKFPKTEPSSSSLFDVYGSSDPFGASTDGMFHKGFSSFLKNLLNFVGFE